MNIEPRPDDEYRTQEEWIQFFNNKKQRMISAPDVLKLMEENNLMAIESLKKDFKDQWLVTSTQIIYNAQDLSATIIQNAESTIVKPKEVKLKSVPVYRGEKLKDVISTTEGLAFLRAIFDTNISADKLTQFLNSVSNKDLDKIKIWSPTQSSRKEKQIRSVDLCYVDFGRFYVCGNGWFGDYYGDSHGVLSDSEPKARSKYKGKKFTEEEIRNNCETDPQKAIAMMMYNGKYKK